jgi:hypothetical protein
MGYRQAVVLLFAASMASAGVLESDEAIRRAAEKVASSAKSIHSYTCIETIERDYYRPRGNTLPRECPVLMEQRKNPAPDMVLLLAARDRLRLEVATSSRGEIHSWPGASRFADSGIETLVREGPIGTGAFGTLLTIVFLQDVKKFEYLGDIREAGRRQFMYIFSVPVSASHYRVKTMDNSAWLTVGYQGVLHIDAETADPVRIMVVTNDLPPAAGVCQTAANLVFKHDSGLGDELLLPASAGQHYVSINGNETQNNISFSNCRQYSSESTITYGASSGDGASRVRPVAKLNPVVDIPGWLPFSMELLSTIDTNNAAGGDRFTARLATPLRDGRRTIAPKGALIEGRVSNVGIGFRPVESVAIGLIPESLEIKGAKIPFAARLDLRTDVVTKQQKKRKGLVFFLPAPGEYPHEIRLPGTHNVLAKGFVSEWMTATPRK